MGITHSVPRGYGLEAEAKGSGPAPTGSLLDGRQGPIFIRRGEPRLMGQRSENASEKGQRTQDRPGLMAGAIVGGAGQPPDAAGSRRSSVTAGARVETPGWPRRSGTGSRD